MKYKWLNKQNNDKIIIFFNGLGMDEGCVKHLDCEDYDIVMFYDYNNLETNLSIDKYKERYLIAWSMGVMTATNFEFKPISATAINGTLKPIDIEYGIHPKIYDLTIKGFNQKKFIDNMLDKPVKIEVSRSAENQKAELIEMKNYSANENFKYTRVIISDNDKIIPTRAQCKYWKQESNLHSGHCPFFEFQKWSELL